MATFSLYLRSPRLPLGGAALVLLSSLLGCHTIKQVASNQVADALAAGGNTFASDDDPELVRQAVPFSLKFIESVLGENPRHRGLLLAAASGFTQYAFAFVQQDADEAEAGDFDAAETGRARAKRLYLRARDYGLRGLAVHHPGFAEKLALEPRTAVKDATKDEVALLYWTAAAWGSAISVGKDDPSLVSQIPQMEALIDRAAALDPNWGEGLIHSFLVSYELIRQSVGGDRAARARDHFEQARQLSQDQQAGVFVTYAESVCVETHDAALFSQLLEQALAIDPNKRPDLRLANLVMQRRARWLLAHRDDLFLSGKGKAQP